MRERPAFAGATPAKNARIVATFERFARGVHAGAGGGEASDAQASTKKRRAGIVGQQRM
jgi:hypothetical protein